MRLKVRYLARVLLLLCLVCPLSAQAQEYRKVTTIAVMPFVKLKGAKSVWLDKAIADLVAQKLSESQSYAVLNRDSLQTFIKEMQFQQSGFVDDTQALERIGRIAKVMEVVYGSYETDGTHITIHLQVMDVPSQVVRSRKDASSDLTSLIALSGQLVDAVLASRNINPTPQEKANIDYVPTDSLSAMEHFYGGLHAYDQGDYETAMGEFFAASRQDPDYLDAQLWFARMLEELGKDDEAIIAYLKLSEKKPESIEGIDARYFAAKLQAKTKPEEAVKTYGTLVSIHPEIPETLEASYEAAQLYRNLKDPLSSYALYKKVDDFSEDVRKHITAYREKWDIDREAAAKPKLERPDSRGGTPQTQEEVDFRSMAVSTRHSRFFEWKHALGLYREAVTSMVELYPDLPPDSQGKAPFPPPRGAYVIDPAHPVISGDVKEKDASLFGGDHTWVANWKETFFALIVPKGYVATGVNLQITGRLPEPTMSTDYTLRVLPFPLPQSYKNSWLGVIYGQTSETATLSKEAPFFGNNQKLLGLQLIENASVIDHWQVTVRLRKEESGPRPQAPVNVDMNAEGALLGKVRLGTQDSHTFGSMPQYILQSQPLQKLALAEDAAGSLWLVGVKGELYGQETDLWMTHSEDGGKNWSASEPMPVNSASLEFAPSLVRAEDGTLQLFFLSNRRGLGWELWTAAMDKNKHWSHPLLVPVRDFAATGLETNNSTSLLLPYSVMQDSHGQWLVAVYSLTTSQLMILASEDLTHWHLHASLGSPGIGAIALGQDRTNRYYLITVDTSGNSAIRYSNDAKVWESASPAGRKIHDSRYPITLLKQKDEGMVMLFSDGSTGLQYLKVSPIAPVRPDLVTASGLEPYAAAETKDGVITAQWKNDDIYIERFHTFAFAENGCNNPEQIIYTERSHDAHGNQWDHIFARERYRVPDVTAVGTAPGGRVWWGIETGIMSLRKSDFFMSDVSQGFFSHYVDTIKSCGDMTWYASRDLDMPQVGYSTGLNPSSSIVGKPLRLSELHGGITAIACGRGKDTYFASGRSEILLYPEDGTRQTFMLPENAAGTVSVNALLFDTRRDRLLAATSAGALFAMDAKGNFSKLIQFRHGLRAVAADGQGHLWVAVEDEGIAVLDDGANVIKTYNSAAIPSNIKKLVPDPHSGIWAIADSYTPSWGLMHLDLGAANFYNPPQKILNDIVDFDIADDGTIWIGSNLDGIYHFQGARR